jgi:hypothetical protein
MAKNGEFIEILDPADFQKIGMSIGGTYWQVDVANATNNSKSQITRFLNKQRTPTYAFAQCLKGMMIERIENISQHFSTRALPLWNHRDTKKAQALIAEAITILERGDAVMPRFQPKPPKPRGGNKAHTVVKARKKAAPTKSRDIKKTV